MNNKSKKGRESESKESDFFKQGMTAEVLDAIALEDEEKITDFKEAAKSSKTREMDARRFECVLGATSLE